MLSSPGIASRETADLGPELARLRLALEVSGQAIYEWNRDTDELIWSESAASALGIDGAPPASAQDLQARLEPQAAEERLRVVQLAAQDGRPFSLEYRFDAGKTAIWVEESGAGVSLPSGGRRVIGVLRVVTKRKKREAQLVYAACYDELTGHLTRARLRECLSQALAEAVRERRPAAFLMAGVDNLGMVNQTYGFEVADEVVARIGDGIAACLPGKAVLGRFAGNKFGIVVPECHEAEMSALADRMLATIRDRVLETRAGPVTTTISIGSVALPKDARTSRRAMSFAQEALEQAKNGGRDRAVAYRPSPEQDSVRRRELSLARDVVGALRERRLVLAYQPIIEAASGHPVEHECLLRMRQTDGSILPAGQFIPTVEKLGLIRLVDRRALELTMEALRLYPSAHLSFNVSALSANDPEWLSTLFDLLQDQPSIASRLTVEITETMALQDLEEASQFVRTLRELGCRVALDDFGAGYTSFRNLKTLAVDMVKIDGSFIRGLADNADNQLFVRTLVDLAHRFRIKTVAEMVDSEAEAEILRNFGVELLQGFYFGRPDVLPPWKNRDASSES